MPEVFSAVFRMGAQDTPFDLPAETFGKRLDKFDLTRIFVGSGLFLGEALDVVPEVFRGFVSGLQQDIGFDAGSATSWTAGWCMMTSSTSWGPIRYPELLMTSSLRPTNQKNPSLSRQALSPV